MGDRADILQRALEGLRDDPLTMTREGLIARDALAEAAACPSGDAQQRLDDALTDLVRVTGAYQVDYEKLADAQQRLAQIAERVYGALSGEDHRHPLSALLDIEQILRHETQATGATGDA
jgi:hypothetical protein